jgi:hypothetical protein
LGGYDGVRVCALFSNATVVARVKVAFQSFSGKQFVQMVECILDRLTALIEFEPIK